MKKVLIGIGIVVLIVLLILIIKFGIIGNKNALKQINLKEFTEKLDKKESFIFVIESESCQACKQYKPILKSVLEEYNLTAYYVDMDVFSEDEYNDLFAIVNFSGTPTTVFFEDGEEKANTTLRIEGSATKDKIISRLEYFKYIDKE